MTHLTRWMIAGIAAALLGACTHNTRALNFSIADVAPAQTRLDAELKTVSMTSAAPGENAGKLVNGTDLALPAWKAALEDAIDRAGVFRDDSPRKVSLSVKITQLDTGSTFGFDRTTTATARYEVIDRASRATLFIADVSSVGHVPADYAFAANERMFESLNRAVRSNIEQFLDQLRTADLSKPVFPPGVPTPTATTPGS